MQKTVQKSEVDLDIGIFDVQHVPTLPEDSTSVTSSGPQEVAGGAVARRVQPNAKCSSCFHYLDHEVACSIGTHPMKCGIGDDAEHGYAPLVVSQADAQAGKEKRDVVARPAQAQTVWQNPKPEFSIHIIGDTGHLMLSERNTFRKSEYRPPSSWLRFMSRFLVQKSDSPQTVAAGIWWQRMTTLPDRFEKGLLQEVMLRVPTESEIARAVEATTQPDGISKSEWRRQVIRSEHLQKAVKWEGHLKPNAEKYASAKKTASKFTQHAEQRSIAAMDGKATHKQAYNAHMQAREFHHDAAKHAPDLDTVERHQQSAEIHHDMAKLHAAKVEKSEHSSEEKPVLRSAKSKSFYASLQEKKSSESASTYAKGRSGAVKKGGAEDFEGPKKDSARLATAHAAAAELHRMASNDEHAHPEERATHGVAVYHHEKRAMAAAKDHKEYAKLKAKASSMSPEELAHIVHSRKDSLPDHPTSKTTISYAKHVMSSDKKKSLAPGFQKATSIWDYNSSGPKSATLKGDELEGYLQGFLEAAAREEFQVQKAAHEQAWWRTNGYKSVTSPGVNTWGAVEEASKEIKGPPAILPNYGTIAKAVWQKLMAKLPDNKNLLTAKRQFALTVEGVESRIKSADLGA